MDFSTAAIERDAKQTCMLLTEALTCDPGQPAQRDGSTRHRTAVALSIREVKFHLFTLHSSETVWFVVMGLMVIAKIFSYRRILLRFITVSTLPITCFAVTDDLQLVDGLWVDRSEVTIDQFALFVQATGTITQAERSEGGSVYDGGWKRMSGWNWRTPFGVETDSQLPAVHITFDEAEAYCSWAGKRLPTEAEWRRVAYTELRPSPTNGFETNTTYPYPTGETSMGANCLAECGDVPALDFSEKLSRGTGPALAGSTRQGVNGLYEMGANVWEWVGIGNGVEQGTIGGSWWYGRAQMHRDHRATKPRDMAAVYIGFRCVRD